MDKDNKIIYFTDYCKKQNIDNDMTNLSNDELIELINTKNLNAIRELAFRYQYGEKIEGDSKKAFELYNKLVNENNDFASKMAIARMYYFGNEYIKQDFKIAMEKFKEIAEADATGEILFYIGYLYENEEIIGIDEEKSFAYYQKAAERGYGLALLSMGQAYLFGIGVEKDCAKAIYWLTKTLESDSSYSQAAAYFILGEIYYEGQEYGFNIISNKEKGLELIKKSATYGYEKAIQKLKEIRNNRIFENAKYGDNTLIIDNNKIMFNMKYEEKINFNDFFIVLFPIDKLKDNNIYKISNDGKVVWNIKDLLDENAEDDAYTYISKINDNTISVISYKGTKHIIDVDKNVIVETK